MAFCFDELPAESTGQYCQLKKGIPSSETDINLQTPTHKSHI